MCNDCNDMFCFFLFSKQFFGKRIDGTAFRKCVTESIFTWVIRQVTEDQYECDSVTNIKRLGKKDEFVPRFEVTIQFLTFQGAHNPPNDKVTLTLEDNLDHIKIKKVEREKNVSGAIVEKICARKNEKIKAHSNDLER